MKYNFDKIIDRNNTKSLKHDNPARYGKPQGLLPLWVADMDFQAPPAVMEALEQRANHGIFGYSEPDGEYFDVLAGWYSRRFGWQLERDWMVNTPGVVTAVYIALSALTKPGDAILIQPPVYYPFSNAIQHTGRVQVENQLRYENGRYTIDLEDFERKIVDNQVKLFILCSPHNPVGRVWTREELEAMGDICLRHGVLVVADEIHQDFIYPGHKHHVFTDLKPAYNDITITCTAPSKTFNLAGLCMSNILIPNKELRNAFKQQMTVNGLGHPGIMGILATQAAYGQGEDWLEELKQYLYGTVAEIRSFLAERLPQVKLVEPEGTYLVWLDCSALGLSSKELDNLMLEKAGLWLDDGPMFGTGGNGFQRVNIACPRSVIKEALVRLETAVKGL